MTDKQEVGSTVFGYQVDDPGRYGVVEYGSDDKVCSIVEKPENPASNYAVTGLYFLDESAPERAKEIKPSARGELEITTLLEMYLHDNLLSVEKMGRGYAWFDTGTYSSLLEAANFVRSLESRQGLQLGCLEEIAYEKDWINSEDLKKRAALFSNNNYGKYLHHLLDL